MCWGYESQDVLGFLLERWIRKNNGSVCTLYALGYIKETRPVTMNIFRKKIFSV